MRRVRRPRAWWRVEIGVAVAVLAIIATVLIVRNVGNEAGSPSPTTESPLPPTVSAVLAVKIDNVAAARPATGVGAADVVYVEPVEGGLTRLLAIYTEDRPDVIGPVRSARQTDIELLGQHGKPVLAYSGAAPHLLPMLHGAALVNASPAEAAAAYYRDGTRAAPHNLYLRPDRLPKGAEPPREQVVQVGPTPAGGTPSATHQVGYRAARYAFTWSPQTSRWLVSLDGTPLVSTETGQLAAATVVEQRVTIGTTESTEDSPGTVSPIARTVGSGKATILRDGQRFDATWTRGSAQEPTHFTDSSGLPLAFAAGPAWILLASALP